MTSRLVMQQPLGLLDVDENAIRRGRERMAALWRNESADYLPIIFGAPVPEQDDFPEINYLEEWESFDKMAAKQLWGCVGIARAGSDAQLAIRPNLGTGFLATCFGLDQQVFPDKMPWLQDHLDRERIEKIELPEDITRAGLMPRARKIFDFYREHLPETVHFYIADTQGPWDIAHLVRGDEIFYELFDAPDFIHHLMRLCTEVYVNASLAMMDMIEEPFGQGYHNNMYMGAGSARMCDDTTTLLGVDQMQEFVLPYEREAFERLGGGWCHYCGHNPHLLKMMIEEIPACRGINFGNPERHDMTEVIQSCLEHGKFYYGGVHRTDGEPLLDYFRRVAAPVKAARKGLIFSPELRDEENSQPAAIIETWHRVQDERRVAQTPVKLQ